MDIQDHIILYTNKMTTIIKKHTHIFDNIRYMNNYDLSHFNFDKIEEHILIGALELEYRSKQYASIIDLTPYHIKVSYNTLINTLIINLWYNEYMLCIQEKTYHIDWLLSKTQITKPINGLSFFLFQIILSIPLSRQLSLYAYELIDIYRVLPYSDEELKELLYYCRDYKKIYLTLGLIQDITKKIYYNTNSLYLFLNELFQRYELNEIGILFECVNQRINQLTCCETI